MRNININRSAFWLMTMVLSLLICIPNTTYAQKKKRTRLKAYYEKLSSDDKLITIILTKGKGKSAQGIPNAQISLVTFEGDSTIEMGVVQTDTLGEAKLMIEPGYPFSVNEDGYSMIELSYDGNDSIRGSSRELEFMDLNVELSLIIDDSIKTAEIWVWKRGEDAIQVPIEDLRFKLGVKRLYNNLYLEDITTDDEGIARFEFPDDIPGDSDGMITVVVKLEDDDDFGTVTKSKAVQWGVPLVYSDNSTERSLFGDSAPLWMIISVAIILIGAWVHFIWAIWKVLKIRKLA